MLNNNQGGLDPSNARTFGNQFGTGQGQGGFPMGGAFSRKQGSSSVPASVRDPAVVMTHCDDALPGAGNLAGLHNIPTSYNLQNTLPQNR